MRWFNRTKAPKTSLDLIEEQLKFWRSKVGDPYVGYEAKRRVIEIENHLMKINETTLPERIKALEEAYAEILLTDREREKHE